MKHFPTAQRGVAVVEFALVLPFLILLSAITSEFGRAMYEYNSLAKAVRDSARYLSMQTPGTHMGEARNLIVYGNTAGTGSVVVRGLSAANVPDPVWQTTGANPIINTVTVRINGYAFQSMFATFLGLPFGTITYSDIAATMRSPP